MDEPFPWLQLSDRKTYSGLSLSKCLILHRNISDQSYDSKNKHQDSLKRESNWS
jgi:hypothetical protein